MSIVSVILRKTGAGVCYLLDDHQYVSERSRKPVQLPNDKHVSFPKLIEKPMKLRPVPATA